MAAELAIISFAHIGSIIEAPSKYSTLAGIGTVLSHSIVSLTGSIAGRIIAGSIHVISVRRKTPSNVLTTCCVLFSSGKINGFMPAKGSFLFYVRWILKPVVLHSARCYQKCS